MSSPLPRSVLEAARALVAAALLACAPPGPTAPRMAPPTARRVEIFVAPEVQFTGATNDEVKDSMPDLPGSIRKALLAALVRSGLDLVAVPGPKSLVAKVSTDISSWDEGFASTVTTVTLTDVHGLLIDKATANLSISRSEPKEIDLGAADLANGVAGSAQVASYGAGLPEKTQAAATASSTVAPVPAPQTPDAGSAVPSPPPAAVSSTATIPAATAPAAPIAPAKNRPPRRCKKDTDCSGDDICEKHACVAPAGK